MKKNSRIVRVSPEFDSVLQELEQDFLDKHGIAPSKTKLTKKIAEYAKIGRVKAEEFDERRTDLI